MKPWYQSKIVLAGIVTTLISILPLVGELLNQADITPTSIITLITGALTVIFRIWFTDVPAALTKPFGIGENN
jgi:hypothetical protein